MNIGVIFYIVCIVPGIGALIYDRVKEGNWVWSKERRDGHVTKTVEPKREIKCPTCGSTNIRKLDVLDRGMSVTMWGLASGKLGKSMECGSCGYRW